jgi:small-conductance mechanosensitive channel
MAGGGLDHADDRPPDCIVAGSDTVDKEFVYYNRIADEMSEQPSEAPNSLISTETKITGIFVILALVSVYYTTTVTDTQWIHFAVLLCVGVIIPTLINEWRK